MNAEYRRSPSWFVWCGPGRPNANGLSPLREIGFHEGTGGRSFAAFGPGKPGALDDLQFASTDRQAVAFSGWLDNRKDFEGQLPAEGRAGGSDAELILSLYKHSGTGMLSKLRGRFAFVVWDGEQDTVLAARDPMGFYPLFWTECRGGLLLSPTAYTLLDYPGVSTAFNRAALADYICDRWGEVEETYFTAIRRVPAGHTLKDHGGGPRLSRTWTLKTIEEAGWADPDEAAEFDERFERAVARCFRFGPVGISLSGGLDSVSVAAVAAQQTEIEGMPRPVALSLRFPDPSCNEEDAQRTVARQLGFPMVMLDLEEATAPHGVLGATLQLAKYWPMPVDNPWMPGYLALWGQGVEGGCKAVLTGGGGDEWLTVTPFLAADLISSMDLLGLARLMRAAARSYSMTAWQVPRVYLWRFGLRPLLRRQLLRSSPGIIDRRDRRRIAEATPQWIAPDPQLKRALTARKRPRPVASSWYEQELRTSLEHPLVSMQFETLYEQGRQLGAPVLAPFMDVDLIELLYRVRPEVLNREGRSKGLVRSTIHTRFPSLDFGSQRKVHAVGYSGRLLAEELAPLWASSGPPVGLGELGLVDTDLLQSSTAEVLTTGSFGDRFTLFRVQCLEMFVRQRL